MQYYEGYKVPSVTTITSQMIPKHPGIYGWERKLRKAGIDPRTELDRLSKIGTIVHFRILSAISLTKLETPQFPFSEYPAKSDVYAEIAQGIWEELDLPVVNPVVEHTFLDTVNLYCGTYDLLCDINGVRTLIDIKTSKAPNDSHLLQVAAYGRYAGAEEAMVVSVCPFIEKNPELVAHTAKLDSHKMRIKSDYFLKLCKEWHLKHNKRQNT
jgi:hypothetical protein